MKKQIYKKRKIYNEIIKYKQKYTKYKIKQIIKKIKNINIIKKIKKIIARLITKINKK